ncbi:sulfatase-like hydrolase/transferase [Cellulophaga baltica]|uniref:sulfatase-like hydrolase/transferase n=1 Tax=Cellulophaga baltica TaxID=76594 RepID=UPI0024942585|nr:sulfatase-like hydrolase/transferase [Cellulophaga baltica]
MKSLLHIFTYSVMTLFIFSCSSKTTAEEITEEIADNGTEDDNPPNILLIIADDMGLDATPNYPIGSIKPNMPNLEGFMANGIKFNNVWVNPLCSPSRATMLTGKYGTQTGITRVGQTLASSEHILQNDMSNYSTALIGKWHLSTDASQPTAMGIDYFAGILNGTVQDYYNWSLVENSNSATSTEYVTSKLTDLSIDWVNAQDDPWFLWLAYNAPHTPFHVPPSNLHSQGDLPIDQASIDTNPLPYFLAALEAMDSEIGRLLASMTDEARDNTVIIFIGDNGSPNQVAQEYERARAKGSVYQGGINVPLVISGKGITRKNIEENSIINAADLYNTILEISGNSVNSNTDSKSFKNVLADSGIGSRAYGFSEVSYDDESLDYTIRTSTHKYILFNDGTEALYDLTIDPLENTNLLDNSLSETDSAIYNDLTASLQEIVK